MGRPYQLKTVGDAALQNRIINGNFDYWQRGTSANSTTTTPFLADRFRGGLGNTGTATSTSSRSTEVPTVAQAGYASVYSHLFTIDTTGTVASNGFVIPCAYSIEGHDFQALHGRAYTLVFWVKASISGTYCVSFRNAAANRSYVAEYTISAANTWERKVISLKGDIAGTWLLDSGAGLTLAWSGGEGSTGQTGTPGQWVAGNFRATANQVNMAAVAGSTFRVAQVMLVSGSFTSSDELPFRRAGKTIQDELSMCQRYYERSASPVADGSAGLGTSDFRSSAYTGATSTVFVPFQVPKRGTPTITTKNDATTTTGTGSMAYAVITVNNYTDGTVTAGERGFRFLAPSAHSAQPVAFGWSAESEL